MLGPLLIYIEPILASLESILSGNPANRYHMYARMPATLIPPHTCCSWGRITLINEDFETLVCMVRGGEEAHGMEAATLTWLLKPRGMKLFLIFYKKNL